MNQCNLDVNLFKHLQKLMAEGCGANIWSASGTVTQLVMVHFIRTEDPDQWLQPGETKYSTYINTMNYLRRALEEDPTTCELLEGIWAARSDIATYINSATFQLLLTSMANVHIKFVMGCGRYLDCTLKPGWHSNLDTNSRYCVVQLAVSTYLKVVQNLPLDAGHWHELWAAGDEVAVCLMEHFLCHEDQRDERWSAEHVRNPAKYLNRNLQNLRDLVAGNIDVCEMLTSLKVVRRDIWACIDGRAMQRIATCLRGSELLSGCAAFLAKNLGSNWKEGLANPRAEVQRCIDAYVGNMYHTFGASSPQAANGAWSVSPNISPTATPRSRHPTNRNRPAMISPQKSPSGMPFIPSPTQAYGPVQPTASAPLAPMSHTISHPSCPAPLAAVNKPDPAALPYLMPCSSPVTSSMDPIMPHPTSPSGHPVSPHARSPGFSPVISPRHCAAPTPPTPTSFSPASTAEAGALDMWQLMRNEQLYHSQWQPAAAKAATAASPHDRQHVWRMAGFWDNPLGSVLIPAQASC